MLPNSNGQFVTKIQALVDNALNFQQKGDSSQFMKAVREVNITIGANAHFSPWERLWLQHLIENRLDNAGLHGNSSQPINVACLIYEALPALKDVKPPQ